MGLLQIFLKDVSLVMVFDSVNKRRLGSYDVSEFIQTIPSLITSLRIIAFPHLVYSFSNGFTLLVYGLFLFIISTDFLDGYIARKLKAESTIGAYFDITVDFFFISGMYFVFIYQRIFSPWILVIIVAVFMQFMLSNIYSKRMIYDPIGKYYGSLLLGGIGLTLLFQIQIVYNIVTFGIVASTIISIFSRIIYFLRAKN